MTRHLPPLSSLRAFEIAARTGSFAAAARVLNVTPPAVAQQVRALEADLGQALFRRAGRGQALTETGAGLAARLAEGFDAIAAAVDRARRAEDGRGLRISATPAFARFALMPRMERFWARHPDIAVSIITDPGLVDLDRDGFDLAIRSGAGRWPGVAAELLVASRLVLVAAPGLAARHTDLSALPWIADLNFAYERGLLARAGYDPDRLLLRPVEDMALVMDAARAGVGVLFATREVAAEDLAAGRLVELPFPGLPETGYWIVTLPGPRRPAVARFADWLKADMALAANGPAGKTGP